MEATSVYWKPGFYALEDSFEVWLCNAHHVKNVPGRQTDMSDAEWLADAKGKLRPKIPQLTEALNGHFGAHHAVAAERIFAHLDFLDASIATLTEQIDARTRPYAAAQALLAPIPGFDRLTIDMVIAETGADRTGSLTDLLELGMGLRASWSGCGRRGAGVLVTCSRAAGRIVSGVAVHSRVVWR